MTTFSYVDSTAIFGNRTISLLTLVAMTIAFIYNCSIVFSPNIHPQLSWSIVFFGLITVLLLTAFLYNKRRNTFFNFTAFYLLSTLTLIITWRLSSYTTSQVDHWLFGIPFGLQVINYFYCAYKSIKQTKLKGTISDLVAIHVEWQLLTIRLYIGFNLVPHFCEKLFAGPAVRAADVAYFQKIGVSDPLLFVIIAGTIELLSCISMGCGFITRLGAICFAIYLFIATSMGGHFSNGFIWANSGGGWEYPILWIVLVLSFSFFGAHGFSIDHLLMERFRLPRWVCYLLGSDACDKKF